MKKSTKGTKSDKEKRLRADRDKLYTEEQRKR